MLIRDLQEAEFERLGQLMVDVYAHLDGFPTPAEQPTYYAMLADIGSFTDKNGARVLVAIEKRVVDEDEELAGGVVYFGDMAEYGSGGTAPLEKHAAGMRLLAVDPRYRGRGVGKSLTEACLELARSEGHAEMVLHTTEAMRVAWGLYERMGFERSPDLDFEQEGFPVFGFRLRLCA